MSAPTVASLKSQGNAAFASKDWTSAVSSYSQALDLETDDTASAALLSNRSAAYLHLGKFDEALADANLAVLRRPTWSKAYARVAEVYARQQNCELAKQAYEQAIRNAEDEATKQRYAASLVTTLTSAATSRASATAKGTPLQSASAASHFAAKVEQLKRTEGFRVDPAGGLAMTLAAHNNCKAGMEMLDNVMVKMVAGNIHGSAFSRAVPDICECILIDEVGFMCPSGKDPRWPLVDKFNKVVKFEVLAGNATWRKWKKGQTGTASSAAPSCPLSSHAAHYEQLGTPLNTSFAAEQRAKEAAKAAAAPLNDPTSALSRAFSRAEIDAAIAHVRGRTTSSGPDKVDWTMLTATESAALLELMQTCLFSGEVPLDWLLSFLVPIEKRTTVATDPSTYRGITLESCALKLLSTLLNRRLEEWATFSNALPEQQQGFRKLFRTENAAFILLMALERARHEKKDVYTCFVDLKKAFDSVDRELLWSRLASYGAKGPVVSLIQHIYRYMRTQVKLGKELSSAFRVEMGVLQGDPMSGMLWILFIATLSEQLGSSSLVPLLAGKPVSHLLMADDVALLAKSREELQRLIDLLSLYCRDSLLTISLEKTHIVLFPFSKGGADCTPLLLDGAELSREEMAKYIGVFFEANNPLKFERHLSALGAKAFGYAAALLSTRRTSNGKVQTSELLAFYRSEVRSRLLFGAELTLTGGSVASLERAEKHFLRRLLKVSNKTCESALYLEVGLLPIAVARLEKAIRFFFYASDSRSPALVRAALADSEALPSGGRTGHHPWVHALRLEAKKYGISLPSTGGAEGIDWETLGTTHKEKYFTNAVWSPKDIIDDLDKRKRTEGQDWIRMVTSALVRGQVVTAFAKGGMGEQGTSRFLCNCPIPTSRFPCSCPTPTSLPRRGADALLSFLKGAAVTAIKLALGLLEEGTKTWATIPNEDKGMCFEPTFIRLVRVYLLKCLLRATRDAKTPSAKKMFTLEAVEELANELIEENKEDHWPAFNGTWTRQAYHVMPRYEALAALAFVWMQRAQKPLQGYKMASGTAALADVEAAKKAADLYDQVAASMPEDLHQQRAMRWHGLDMHLRAGGMSIKELFRRAEDAERITNNIEKIFDKLPASFDSRVFVRTQVDSVRQSLSQLPPGQGSVNDVIKPVPTLNMRGTPRGFNPQSAFAPGFIEGLPGSVCVVDVLG
ncbi:hypothetical protein JCM10213_002611 [Rhodosporidiobolus nylandii]